MAGRRAIGLSMATMLAMALFTSALASEPQPATFRGHHYGDVATVSPTEDKAQSKLWFNDGAWWSAMLDSASNEVRVFELRDHIWHRTDAVIDDRPDSTADALWDGQALYAVSRTSDSSIRVVRLDYSSSSRTYTVSDRFPVEISQTGTQSATIDKDSRGRLWVTYAQARSVWMVHSLGPEWIWTDPYQPAIGDVTVSSDDISTVAAFDGHLGLMWSDQRGHAFRFAVRADDDPLDRWSTETPLAGVGVADDHISLKAGSDGWLFAAVKTSQDEVRGPAEAPLTLLLFRTPEGEWHQRTLGTVADEQTRPVVLVGQEEVYVLAASPSRGGTIYGKQALLPDLRFERGLGTPWIERRGTTINNPSGSKHSVTGDTGIVVLATSGGTDRRYYHAEVISIAAGPTTSPDQGASAPPAGASPPAAAPNPPPAAMPPGSTERAALAVLIELLLVGTLLFVAGWLLSRFRRSALMQVAVAALIGLAAAFVIIGDRMDLIPDGEEEALAVGVLAAVILGALFIWLMQRTRPSRR